MRSTATLLLAVTLGFYSTVPDPVLAQAQTVSFAAPSNYAVGTQPQTVAVGDFRGIGVQDLAVVNAGSNTVSVLLGNGDGTFQAARSYPVGLKPTSVAVSALRGTTVQDLVVANSGSTTVSVLLGNGDGTFQPARDFLVGNGPYFVAVGDFRGIGRKDLVTANFGSNTPTDNTISVLLGNGDGTFQPAQTYVADRGPIALGVGNFRGIVGRQDLVVVNYGSTTVSVLLGNGDGTFQPARNYPVGCSSGPCGAAVAVGDFRGTGIQDLAVAIYGDGTATTVSVLLGNGDGTFQAPQSYGVGPGPTSIATGDFRGIGRKDLVTANWQRNAGNTVSVLLGLGNGTFQAAQNFPTGLGVAGVAVGTFTRSGRQDLATANYNAGTVSVLLNTTASASGYVLTVNKAGTGTGTVTSSETPPSISCGPSCATASASYPSGTTVTLTASGANGSTFTGWSGGGCTGTGPCVVTMNGPTTIAATFTLQTTGYTLTVNKAGTGTGTVTSSETPPSISCGPTCATASASYPSGTVVTLTASAASGSTFAGWTGGGCTGTGPCTVTMNASTTVSATFTVQTATYTLTVNKAGTGTGTVTSSETPPSISCGPTCATASASYSSGTSVTLTASPASGSTFASWSGCDIISGTTCTVTMNAAKSVTATFTMVQQQVATPTFSPAGGTYVGSVTVTLSTATSGATIHYTTDLTTPTASSPVYTGPIAVAQTTTIQAVAMASGMADSNVASAVYTIQSQAQPVSFAAPSNYVVGTQPEWVAVGDFRGIGVQDLAAVNRGSNSVSVLLGNGDGTFRVPQTYSVGAGPTAIAVGDVRGIGRLDLVVCNWGNGSGNTVSVLLGNGDGTFQAARTYVVGLGPYFVAVGDFRGIGRKDLVTANFGTGTPTDNTISVLLSNGDGTFQPAQTYVVDRAPIAVAVGNFRGIAGRQDLVTVNYSSTNVSVLLGNGDGTFQAARNYPVGCSSGPCGSAVAVGDFRGNGIQDLAVAIYGDGTATTVVVLLGNGDGSFRTPQSYGVGPGPTGIAVGDFRGIGRKDLVTANWQRNAGTTVSVLLGSGDGTFQTAQNFPTGIGVAAVAVGTFTRSGRQDLATANYNAGTVSVLLNTTAPATSYTLTVNKAGTGSGTVTSSETPPSISCGPTCGTASATYTSGTPVTLTASPASGSTFGSWTGCDTVSGTTCTVTMSAAKSVTATFNVQTFTLTVNKAGTGSGTVTSSETPPSISCGPTCATASATYTSGTAVTLTASPASGSTFASWSGCDTVSGTTCTVTMSAAKAVTATFNVQTFALTVNKAGTGSGTVTSSETPPSISCGPTCATASATYTSGTAVTLTASPASGSTFASWSGCDTVSGTTCTVTMSAAKAVTATFNVQTFALTVNKAGTGSGTVTSSDSPPSISCGPTCATASATYTSGTAVTLTASPASGSTFTGWSGGCAGTGPCTVTMNAAITVTATFTRQFTLTVTVQNLVALSSGTVTSNPPGINCGTACSAPYNSGTAVTLTATPAFGSVFVSWGGACAGILIPTCTVTMTTDASVTATFGL